MYNNNPYGGYNQPMNPYGAPSYGGQQPIPPYNPSYNPMNSMSAIPPAMGSLNSNPPMGGMGGPPMGGMGAPMSGMGGMGGPPMGSMGGMGAPMSGMSGMGGGMGGMQSGQSQWYANYYNMLQQNEIQELQNWFRTVDRDGSGQISARELQMLTFGGVPLGLDTAIKLVKVFDKDRSGSIDFFEFAAMHKFISLMQQAFGFGDRDRSGTLDCREIHNALNASGFHTNFASTQLFFTKVARGTQAIPFASFLQMGVDIALLKSKFEWTDSDKDGVIHINFDQLLELCADL